MPNRDDGLIMPDGFAGTNLLKYEMRLNGRLPQQIGVPEVQASTLSESEFYRLLVRKWQKHYFSISKLNQLKTKVMSEIKTVSDAFDVLVAQPIKLRAKSLSNGNKSLYLDIYKDGKRTYEFLKLYIIPEVDETAKARNANTLQAANAIKAQKIIELKGGNL